MEHTVFEFRYHVTGADRKRLVQAIGEITGTKPKYLGAPSFAYRAGAIMIDRNGTVSFDEHTGGDEAESLAERLRDEFSFEPEPYEGMEPMLNQPENLSIDGNRPLSLTVEMPREFFTETTLGNLTSLIAAKSALIKKALGSEDLTVEVTADKVCFPWFGNIADPDEVKAYTHFVTALCGMARNQKRVLSKAIETDNEKYTFRCFLLRLGFIGAEYKTERKVLLRNLAGSSAFRRPKESDPGACETYGTNEDECRGIG